jgi:serpin B
MRIPRCVLAGFVTLPWLVIGCGPGADRVGPEPRTLPLDDRDVSAVAEGSNAFALGLYKELARRDGNLFLSPYGLSTALAMTYGGARSETARQMARTLRFKLDGRRLHVAFGSLMRDLNARAGAFDLRSANALWGQRGGGWLESFAHLIKTDYGAPLHGVDFVNDADGAAREINAWVERETRKRIRDIVGPGSLGPLTRLVLANAIYFKGDWLTAFSEHATHDAPFRLAGGGEVKARMMFRSGGFWYHETADAQVLEIPYKGDDLSMIIVLPRAANGLRALEKSMSPSFRTSPPPHTVVKRRWRKVLVYLPKFTFTSEFSLAETLSAMGMPLAFAGEADFSGMNGKRDLFISAVLHKAFVEVNESGTEAAAASAVLVKAVCRGPSRTRKPPVFRADHPFLFMIRDRRTHQILFMGRVMDPMAGESGSRT